MSLTYDDPVMNWKRGGGERQFICNGSQMKVVDSLRQTVTSDCVVVKLESHIYLELQDQ